MTPLAGIRQKLGAAKVLYARGSGLAANLPGEEGKLLRKVLPWSLVLLLVMCLIVLGQSTAVLSWMLP